MSWLVLSGLALAEDPETSSEEEPSELQQIEEKIRIAEALIRLADAEARLAEMEAKEAKVVTDEPAASPTEPAEVSPPEPPEPPEPAEVSPPEPPDPPDVVVVREVVAGLGDTRIGGDLRVDLFADRLDNLHPEVAEDPSLAFVIPVARLSVDHDFGQRASARIELQLAQDQTSTSLDTSDGASVAVPAAPSGWSAELLDAHLAYAMPRGGTFTLGNARLPFGVVDSYEGGGFPLPGPALYLPVVVGEGLLPQRSLGLGWNGGLGEMVRLDVNLTNSSEPEVEIPKDLSLRVAVTPIEALTVSASVLAGPGTGGATKVGYEGVAFVHAGPNRALVEVYGRQGLGPTSLGAAGHLARDFETGGAASRVTPVVRVSWFDPDQDTPVDHHTGAALAIDTAWSDSGVSTNLGYEVVVPDDVDLAIEHRAVLECRLQF